MSATYVRTEMPFGGVATKLWKGVFGASQSVTVGGCQWLQDDYHTYLVVKHHPDTPWCFFKIEHGRVVAFTPSPGQFKITTHESPPRLGEVSCRPYETISCERS